MAHTLVRRLFDLIFPKYCLGCFCEGSWLCPKCRQKVIIVKSQLCPGCERLSPSGRFCLKCRRGKALKGILAAFYFQEGPLKELVHNFKYNHILELKEILAQGMAEVFSQNYAADDRLIVSFVPLHWLRKAQRGYNQAEVLAQEVARALNLPEQNLLRKVRATPRQVELPAKKRRENLGNAFCVRPQKAIKGKTIILIDDIATTGTTLNECAKVLKKAGAREVWGLVVARG